MKTIYLFVLLFVLTFSVTAQNAEKLWETTDTVLLVPESVLFADSVLFVSNVNGSPTEKNGKGFVSKLSLNGEILKKDWATGLNAPKGMGISAGFLFVSDIDKVAVIDIKTGNIVNTYEFAGAKFLNDITVDKMGKVYISDMNDKAIYVIQEDFSKLLIKDEKLNYVNGLFWENGALLAGTSDGVYTIDRNGKIVSHYIKDTGGIDGLERITKKQLIITDWAGKVHIISPNEKPKLLLNFEDEKYNAADLGINVAERFIYIPTFFANTVAAYKIVY